MNLQLKAKYEKMQLS